MRVSTSTGIPAASILAAAAVYRPRKIALGRSSSGSIAGEEPAQGFDIALTVIQESLPLGLAPGSASGGQLLETFLFGYSESVEAMPGHRSQEAGSVREIQAVRFIAELDEQVEDSSRERPVESQETAQLGGSVIGDEKRVGADSEWRLRSTPQFGFPEPEGPSRAIFPSDHTDRERRVCRPGSEFEIAEPDLPVIVEALAVRHGLSLPHGGP
jgi:hypothetical protein